MDTHITSRDAEKTSVDTNAAQAAQASYTSEIETPAFALNIQNQVARLSMLQAHASKNAAADKLGDVQQERAKMMAIHKIIGWAGKLATDGVPVPRFVNVGAPKTEYDEVLQYLKDHGFQMPSYRNYHCTEGGKIELGHCHYLDKDHSAVLMRQLNGVKEEINARMQAAMTQLQDFMGQYQSYLDGSHTASAKANEITMKLAR